MATNIPRPRGRPRRFDPDEGVATAQHLFHARGYDAVSVSDVTEALGINPPSFYAAFGSKELLFRRAIELYASLGASIIEDAIAKPTAYEAVEHLLRETADSDTDPSRPAGCLFVQGALCSSDKAVEIRSELQARRTAIGPILEARLRRAGDESDDSIAGDPQKVTLFVMTVIQGLAVQATSGCDRAALHHVVDVTLSGLRSNHS
jgi:AcrR family transcriptional regulator